MRARALVLVLAAVGCRGVDTDTSVPPDTAPEVHDSGETGEHDDTGETGHTDPPPSCTQMPNPSELGPDMCVVEAPCAWWGAETYEFFGSRVDAGADLDGDERHDAVVGAPNHDTPFALGDYRDGGRVVLLSGAALDLPAHDGVLSELTGTSASAYLGEDVAIAGDVDGDGSADLLLGEPGADGMIEAAGAAWLVLGPVEPGAAAVDSVAAASFLGASDYSRVGLSVGPGGDLDGDGLDDLALAGDQAQWNTQYEREDRGTGVAYVVLGRETGWSQGMSLADADISLTGEEDQDLAGKDLTAEGDLDGDGYADLVVGAPYASWPGAAYVLAGSAEGVDLHGGLDLATVRILGDTSGDTFGYEVTTGDVNGDGVDDLVVGAPLGDVPWSTAGEVHLYAGGGTFFEGPEPLSVLTGTWDDQQVGTGLDCADVDGDGIDDLLVGASGAMQGLVTRGGRAALIYGRDTWEAQLTLDDAGAVFHGAEVKDYLGRAGALGDLDGDGLADLLLASSYANGGGYDLGALYLFWGG